MMKRSLLVTLVMVGLLSGGFVLLEELGAGSPPGEIIEQQVNANLMHVRVNGQWEEFPMVPLADHLCISGNRLFKKYCGDELLAPGSRK